MKDRATNGQQEIPEWFTQTELLTPKIFQSVAKTLSNADLDISIRLFPEQAFWFLSNTLLIANQANRKGMHANALAITRLCVEAITIVELGLVGTPDAANLLSQWSNHKKKPGELRSWLEANAWGNYGRGMWDETWATFFANFSRAIQPFAHYSGLLAQWQNRTHNFERNDDGGGTAILEIGPTIYDPQKATRVTLFHGIITFVLGRIFLANLKGPTDLQTDAVNSLGRSLSESPYLDGHSTNWPEQFWGLMWFGDSPIPRHK
jgi:hypothetical protein